MKLKVIRTIKSDFPLAEVMSTSEKLLRASHISDELDLGNGTILKRYVKNRDGEITERQNPVLDEVFKIILSSPNTVMEERYI